MSLVRAQEATQASEPNRTLRCATGQDRKWFAADSERGHPRRDPASEYQALCSGIRGPSEDTHRLV